MQVKKNHQWFGYGRVYIGSVYDCQCCDFYTIYNFRINVKMDNVANKTYFGGCTTVEQQIATVFDGEPGT